MLVSKVKKIASKSANIIFAPRGTSALHSKDVASAREYIKDYWEHLKRYNPKDKGSLIGLPKPYLVPSYSEGHEFDYNELYYWDSYFMVQGMLDEEHRVLVMGILEDLVYEFNSFKLIPNGSQLYYVSRSQPPFLTSFIFDVYGTYGLDKKWLKSMIEVAKEEYSVVWMGVAKPNARQIHRGLSRYYDFNYLHDIAEAESGWDMTTRFERKCMNFLPADLNALLYKYEADFVRAAQILGDTAEEKRWQHAATLRKKTMTELMWSKMRGLFMDYNFVKKRHGTVSSLASYYSMWAGLASEAQAKAMVRALRRFENKGGLATTDSLGIGKFLPGSFPTQWAYPNGWAPLQFLVIKGLQRYGYDADAKRLALKWLHCNLQWFKDHGEFLEKYNVVDTKEPPARGVYPAQTGFGWTNAVFERLCQEYVDKK